MKKEKVYAAFLKEAFLKPDEAVSGKRLERQLRQLQKGKDVRPKQEASAALAEFLKEKQLEPTGKAGTVRHPVWKPAIAAVVVAVMVGSAGLYTRQSHLKGSDGIGLECSVEKDASSSWQETVMDSRFSDAGGGIRHDVGGGFCKAEGNKAFRTAARMGPSAAGAAGWNRCGLLSAGWGTGIGFIYFQ